MSEEYKKLPCDVYLDLIPLVRDNVASEESNMLVYKHIEECLSCKMEFENTYSASSDIVNDRKIIKSIRNSFLLSGLIFMVCGALMGVYISNSSDMFYNLLIMPIVGGIGFLILKKNWNVVPIGVFAISYIYLFINNITTSSQPFSINIEIFLNPLFLSSIYTVLTLLGVAIAFLLKFAFRKEVKE